MASSPANKTCSLQILKGVWGGRLRFRALRTTLAFALFRDDAVMLYVLVPVENLRSGTGDLSGSPER
jgi:hypothetical protein